MAAVPSAAGVWTVNELWISMVLASSVMPEMMPGHLLDHRHVGVDVVDDQLVEQVRQDVLQEARQALDRVGHGRDVGDDDDVEDRLARVVMQLDERAQRGPEDAWQHAVLGQIDRGDGRVDAGVLGAGGGAAGIGSAGPSGADGRTARSACPACEPPAPRCIQRRRRRRSRSRTRSA